MLASSIFVGCATERFPQHLCEMPDKSSVTINGFLRQTNEANAASSIIAENANGTGTFVNLEFSDRVSKVFLGETSAVTVTGRLVRTDNGCFVQVEDIEK